MLTTELAESIHRAILGMRPGESYEDHRARLIEELCNPEPQPQPNFVGLMEQINGQKS